VEVEYVRDEKVVRGRNGRLFIDGDTNRVLSQHSGELLFTPDQLEQWRTVLERRLARFSGRGVPYHFVVPPNPHSVFPEDLPEGLPPPASVRPVTQLIGHLDAHSDFRLLYPLDLLLEAKQRGELIYSKTDSHWSGLGAFLAYKELAARLAPEVEMTVLDRSDMEFREYLGPGDLGFKLEPMETSPALWVRAKRPAAQLVSDNRIRGSGTLVVTRCDDAKGGTCLVFGDSFTHQLLPSLASSFRRMVFAQLHFVDDGLVEAESPDVVLSVLNERFLIRPSVDDPEVTLETVLAGKPPKMPLRDRATFWD